MVVVGGGGGGWRHIDERTNTKNGPPGVLHREISRYNVQRSRTIGLRNGRAGGGGEEITGTKTKTK